MDADFWHDKWRRGETGFNRPGANPLLTTWWHALEADPGSGVFVPLCGKSADMIWLRDQGHPVVGVELSRRAIDAFAEEQFLNLAWSADASFTVARGDGLTLLCGDYFDLRPADLAGNRLVYDRAALIALPEPMRRRYVSHLRELLPPGWRMLLVTLDYPQEERPGPPFSVSGDEVHRLFPGCAIELLHEEDVLAQNPKFAGQGASRLWERVYRILCH